MRIIFRRRVLLIVVPVLLVGSAVAAVAARNFWQNLVPIAVTVHPATMNAGPTVAFTDDDDHVNGATRDPNDTGLCEDVAGVAPTTGGTATTSCDPAASGPDVNPLTGLVKPRYPWDIGRCVAAIVGGPAGSPAPGGNSVTIDKINAYPGYWCTTWVQITNAGTVPVVVNDVQVCPGGVCQSIPFDPNPQGLFDLNGDGVLDVGIDVTEINRCQVILPRQSVYMDIDEQVLDGVAPASTAAASDLSEPIQIDLEAFAKARNCAPDVIHGAVPTPTAVRP